MGLIFRHGEICVCEVEQILDVTQSKASRHLRYLRDAGLLTDRRDGVTVYYGVPSSPESGTVGGADAAAGSAVADPLPDAAPRLVQLRAARGGETAAKPAGEVLAPDPTS
jgi:DNA-binding transcriptional ArsR family regulator